MLTRPDSIIHHKLYIIHKKSGRDVACHVDSTICHPEEIATKDLGNTHLTKTRLFASLGVTRWGWLYGCIVLLFYHTNVVIIYSSCKYFVTNFDKY